MKTPTIRCILPALRQMTRAAPLKSPPPAGRANLSTGRHGIIDHDIKAAEAVCGNKPETAKRDFQQESSRLRGS